MLVAIEGIDGSGKTTLAKTLSENCDLAGEVVYTKQPGGNEVCKEIADVIFKCKKKGNLEPIPELLLFLADRYQHYVHTIFPEVCSGKTVICDRYIFSTFVYQSEFIPLDRISSIHNAVMPYTACQPHLTLFIDTDAEIAYKRVKKTNIYDSCSLETYKKRSEIYRKICEDMTENVVTINGNQPRDEVYNHALTTIKHFRDNLKTNKE